MIQKQALVAALGNARRYAAGGGAPPVSGFLHSAVPGRTDKLPINVASGAYVLPADHVAALGQGNSLAGADIVNKMFKMGPYGATQVPLHAAKAPKQKKMKLADGGATGSPTPIVAAGGEIVLPPDKIAEKYGDVARGHEELDKWVVGTRAKHIKTLRGLKPPKKD